MAHRGLKRFSDLAFLQGLDKPRWLVPLLAGYKDYFDRQHLDLSSLRNDDASDRLLLEVFTRADEEMPADLLEALYVIDDLADEDGHDRIVFETTRTRKDMSWVTDPMAPGDFAIGAYLKFPRLVENCHDAVNIKVKNYYEFQAKDDTPLPLTKAEAKNGELETALAPWFKAHDRTDVCQVYPYRDGAEIHFCITHGELFRTQATIDKRRRRSRAGFRPQGHDAVIFVQRTSTLKINARSFAERELYRTKFGEVLFGDPNHFPSDAIYTLTPLRRIPLEVKTVVGIKSARLVEAWVKFDDEEGFVQVSRSNDLLATIRRHGQPNLRAGRVVRAAFMLKYDSGGRPRKIEIRVPNVGNFDRTRDLDVTENFFRRNDYLKIEEDGDDTPDAAGPASHDNGPDGQILAIP